MVTVPEANRILWEALDTIYETQLGAAKQAQQALAKLMEENPELAHDPLARDALRAATQRQDGIGRYAESQVALAETMRLYWEQRAAATDLEPELIPPVRRGNPFTPTAQRAKATATLVE